MLTETRFKLGLCLHKWGSNLISANMAFYEGLSIIRKGKTMKPKVPVWEKKNLILEEAAALFNIGSNKIRELSNQKNCNFVLWVGNKRLIKKNHFEKFLEKTFSI